MTFRVLLHPKVEGVIDKLEHAVAERIRKKLRALEENPFRFLEHYEGLNVFKLRIGDYRALIDKYLDSMSKLSFPDLISADLQAAYDRAEKLTDNLIMALKETTNETIGF